MKVSPEQVATLYQFTRQHFVEHYDLQTELVDHLANAIEAQWQQNPTLSFEDALQVEFKKFGVFGFMDVVNKRRGALTSKYAKMFLGELKAFFTLPKIIGTVSSAGIVFYLLHLFQPDYLVINAIFLVLCLGFTVGLYRMRAKYLRVAAKTEKKWLMNDVIFGYRYGTGFIYLYSELLLHVYKDHYPEWFLVLLSLQLVVLLLTFYIVLILLPSKADYYLRKTYPEYEKALLL